MGGEDFDQKVMDWVIEQYQKEEGIDLSQDPLALQRLKEAAEKAKIELSTAMETEINLPFITSDASGPKHLLYKLSRAQVENLTQEYVDKAIDLVKQTLKEAKASPQDINEIILVGGQTRMPAIQEAVKNLFGKEANKTINPDEVVAIGAAIQAGILQGDVKDVLLLDVTPLSLGIETLGGVNTILIPKNTTVPTAKNQVFSTAADNQTSVEVHVLQGERSMVQDSKSLGRFILDGIPPSPRGIPQVEVTFDIDANGILNVTAKDKASNKAQSIRIEGSTGISEEEVEKMKQDAEAHGEEDKKNRELVEAKNTADALIYTAEKSLKEAGDKVSEGVKKEVGEKVEVLKKAKEGVTIDQIRGAINGLSEAAQKMGSEMYKTAGAEKPQANQNEQQQDDGDANNKPEEGEFKEKQ